MSHVFLENSTKSFTIILQAIYLQVLISIKCLYICHSNLYITYVVILVFLISKFHNTSDMTFNLEKSI